MNIQNQKILSRRFLRHMQTDSYYPSAQVEKGIQILLRLCESIEAKKPQSLDQLYALTHAATDEFNRLDEELVEYGSEIESAARDIIAGDFEFIAQAYGFDADVETLIGTRFW